MHKQINFPVESITTVVQAPPLNLVWSGIGRLLKVGFLPTNFSVGPAPTALVIVEYADDQAAEMLWTKTITPPALASGAWCIVDGDDDKHGLVGLNHYFQIVVNQGSLDLEGKLLYDLAPGQNPCTFDERDMF